jgi:hypothetical protein
MALLTFDNLGSPENPNIKDLLGSSKPDVVECGENNEVWVNARRSTKTMELVSKVDAKVLKKVRIDDEHFEATTTSWGIGPRQIGAVRAAIIVR